MPAALAGTIQSNEVHQLTQSPLIVSVSSAAQPSGAKVLPTIRDPGLSARNFGVSLLRLWGSRNSASTVALEMSASYMSPSMKVALPATPAAAACLRESSTMSWLNSTPTAVAPRFAAAMMLRPSPDPRSIT